MPYRNLNADEVAAYLHLSREDVDLLVRNREIPHAVAGGRPVFRRSEVDAWASQRILGMNAGRLAVYHKRSSAKVHDLSPGHALMPELLLRDRIGPGLTSRTKPSIIRDMTDLADGTGLVSDRGDLLASLEEREQLCSTALPGGLAILHPRHHEPYMFVDSFLVLGRAVHGVHFGAHDGTPTDIFFLVCCQDDRMHLHTLARVCSMCQATGLLAAIRDAADAAGILEAVIEAERMVIAKL